MTNIFLVAAREFRQIAGTRSFWLTLLILPIAFAIGPLAQHFMSNDEPDRVMIIDRSGGGAAEAIAARIEREHDRDVLSDLSRYVRRHHLERADPDAVWAVHDQLYDDAAVARFVAAGGVSAALAKIKRVLPEETPVFEPAEPDYRIVPVPAKIAATPDATLDAELQPLLHPEGKGRDALDYALLIPHNFGADPAVRLWANGRPGRFAAIVQDELTRDLRAGYVVSKGLTADVAQTLDRIAPVIAVSSPPPGGGAREAMLIRSILPLAASYLLMMSLMLSGSWMLQGTVEERSNKLLETVLACVTPEELMVGKLLGTVAVGLSMIAVWIGCGAVAAYATQGAIADLIQPALAPITSPGVIVAMIYFFVVGYISTAVFFLAIGVMSDSMRDAQGYLTPVILIILLPIVVLMQGIMEGGGGIGIEVLTWVPIWTPFAVLARLGSGIPVWEVIATGVLLAAFTAIELMLLGRLFRASLLAAGARPSLATITQRLKRA
jgi:ABC-type Na+ efflux pump permease subunit